MGRPRGFDETEVIAAAAALFASRAYDGVSVDDLVTHLGVHRNSLYKTFGSKRGLYLAALRWHLAHEVRPRLSAIAADPADAAELDLLLLAALERAPVDEEVAVEVARTLADLDAAGHTTALILGLRLRAKATHT